MQTFFRPASFRVFWGVALLSAFVAGVAFSGGLLSVGQEAPAFAAPDANGKTFDLTSYRGKGPVILVFYRGYF